MFKSALDVVRISVDPYSAFGGFTIAYQVAEAAGAKFEAGPPLGPCFIECDEADAPTVLAMLQEQGVKAHQ